MRNKILVVIPNRGAIFYTWCLEFAIAESKNNDVYVLDASRFSSRYYKRSFRWWLDVISMSNPFPRFAKKICERESITYLNNYLNAAPLEKFKRSHFKKLEKQNIFQESVRATYALSFGSSNFSYFDVKKKFRERELRSFCRINRLTQSYISRFQISQVVTCNGRLVPQAAVVFAALSMGIKYRLLEYPGPPGQRYCVYENSPHSVNENQMMVKKVWEEAYSNNPKEAIRLAKLSLVSRVENSSREKISSYPLESLNQKKYIAFFPTTDYEFAAIASPRDLRNEFDQRELFKALGDYCLSRDLKLVVRVHPQADSKHLQAKENAIWTALSRELNALCITAEDNLDSLTLARNSKVNVVYASTIALEIAFLGLPLVVCSRTPFSNLIKSNCVLDLEKLADYLEQPPRIQSEQLYPFAYFESMAGVIINYFRVINVHEIYVGTTRIDTPNFIMSLRHKVVEMRNLRPILNFTKKTGQFAEL